MHNLKHNNDFMKNIATIFFTSLLSGAITLGAYKLFIEKKYSENNTINTTTIPNQTISNNYLMPNLTDAAKNTINRVVHVKNVTYRTSRVNPILEYFYGYQGGREVQPQIGTGSGVIISEDGYIVTNNHVIKGANELEITLNDNRSFPAKLIGTDPKTDIALLKIDTSEKLPYATFADSDAIEVGEWVLAVGNPYNLNSTVTAGIISTKARNLSSDGIQSFIQTDAAVNPGNSGGALVNTRGELIGINTLISSETGSYVGYSFAVPSNMARKIIEDILEFGNVQQGSLGVHGYELNKQIADQKNIQINQGFFIEKVVPNSGAELAGIKKGDAIIKIDDKPINNFLELNSAIATKRPNDEVNVTVIRNNKQQDIIVKLSKKELPNLSIKGFELKELNSSEKQKLGINYGVKINGINNEKLKAYENDLKDAVILAINGVKISDLEQAHQVLQTLKNQNNISLDILTVKKERIRLII